jgi:adenylate cyclase
MFTDLAGFTQLGQADERGALRLIDAQEALLRPVVEAHRGRQIKSMGDGLLIEFANALDAVECAVDVQRHVQEYNAEPGVEPLRLRIGLHLGDVQRRGSDILGDAVNVASRIEPLAEPGGICLSEQLFAQVRNKIPYQLEKLGSRRLKGVQDPMDIYRVVLPWMPGENIPHGPREFRLAVLPLASISPDPTDDYFADGLTEELISVLSRLRGLRVIARTSVNQYKATPKPVRQIGSELGVGSLLEGSVRRAGNRLRITLQLIDAETEEHRWAQTYNRELSDVFEIQAEVAEQTAAALRLEILGSDREALHRAPTRDLEAYELYLKGIVAWQRTADEGWTRRGTDETARYFEAAIEKDPRASSAYAYLANLYIAAMGEVLPRSEVRTRIQELVQRALELDPKSPEAHTARGNQALQLEGDWARAEAEFLTAIRLNPSSMPAHAWYGILLRSLGRFEDSLRQLELALELDPLFRQLTYWRITVLESAGDLEGAVAAAREALARDPGDRHLHIRLGSLFLAQGRTEDARREVASAVGDFKDAARAVERAELLAQLGDPGEARRLVDAWERKSEGFYIRGNHIARLLVALGEKERALELLERTEREEEGSLWIDFRRRGFDPVRDDPRFVSLVKSINLPTQPPTPGTKLSLGSRKTVETRTSAGQ